MLVSTGGCARPPARQILFDSRPIAPDALTVQLVQQAVITTPRERDIVYRGPTIGVSETVDLGEQGEALGLKNGRGQHVRLGFLFGVRDRASGTVQHFLSFQSSAVEGIGRFASVRLADGRPLRFMIAASQVDPCIPPCFLVFETLIAAVPEAELRAVPDGGLPMFITLDNGFTFPIRAPAVYVRGYLAAVDAQQAGNR
jgi:hypothetical protein